MENTSPFAMSRIDALQIDVFDAFIDEITTVLITKNIESNKEIHINN